MRSQRPGASVGLGGLSTAGTNYIVDGMNNMISRAGDAREDVPQSAIQEFKVIVTQSPAEYGGRVGGVVNVVTKGGGNRCRRSLRVLPEQDLNRVDLYAQQSHDQLGTPIPDFSRNQFGGAVGGPLIKDRLHFYTRSNEPTIRSTSPSTRASPGPTRHSRGRSRAARWRTSSSRAATCRSARRSTRFSATSGRMKTTSASRAARRRRRSGRPTRAFPASRTSPAIPGSFRRGC